MKRIVFLFCVATLSCIISCAQDGLNINKVFGGRYHDDPSAAESIIQGNDELEDMGIRLVRTLKITDKFSEADFIEPLVVADGARAIEKTVSYKEGKLYYGYYFLPPKNKKYNRFIIYLNQQHAGGNKINLIYIEGRIKSLNDVKSLFKNK